MSTIAQARFDTRMTVEQKEFFEYAAQIGGFRTLTEFFMHAVQTEADKIVERHKQILASRKDQEIFFKAIINPPKPNPRLKQAAKRYLSAINK